MVSTCVDLIKQKPTSNWEASVYMRKQTHSRLGEGTVCYIKVKGTVWRKGRPLVGMGEETRGASERENTVIEYEVFE